ncbi:MAG: heme-binding protein [Gemmataceae bacterium]
MLGNPRRSARPGVEPLEPRNVPATASLVAGTLTVAGTPERDNLRVSLDERTNELVVRSFASEIGRFDAGAVGSVVVEGGGGRDVLAVDRQVRWPATIRGDEGSDILKGGGGDTALVGGTGDDKLQAGPGATTFDPDGGDNLLFNVKPLDTVIPGEMDTVRAALPVPAPPPAVDSQLTTADVEALLQRAAAATASNDAVISVVDRNGRVLGVRAERDLVDDFAANQSLKIFAVDGALAKARTGAFFANNQAPLTSRTVQFISQSTMTQREIESNPSIPDQSSTLAGPGFVAPIGIKNHFPPDVSFTPQVDLFLIEHTNRDSSVGVPNRFNIPTLAPGVTLYAPDSYGVITGENPSAVGRGIATLPGGIPIYKGGELVGGLGVFFPGSTGFANEENSALSVGHDPSKPDRSYEAEYMAFAAVGGAPAVGAGVGAINGIPPVDGITFPLTPEQQRIDLVGITLDIVGPGGRAGPGNLLTFASTLPGVNRGDPNSGVDLPVTAGTTPATLQAGLPVPDGWLVLPKDGVGVTADEVRTVIERGIAQANETRAAIRLPLNSTTRMVFAVSDQGGEIVGLYRMPDATVFSLDVAVAKARNVAYYSSARLQAEDQLPGVPLGTALTARSFRYVTLPRYPEGIDGSPPGPFSILNDGGVDPRTGLNVGPPLPASAYQSVQGYDAFHPGTNFRDPLNRKNQNGVVFFPGSETLFRGEVLIGGFGVSGDGVDQDDVVTVAAAADLAAPDGIHIDNRFVLGVRVPYHKYNRNPEGGIR